MHCLCHDILESGGMRSPRSRTRYELSMMHPARNTKGGSRSHRGIRQLPAHLLIGSRLTRRRVRMQKPFTLQFRP